MHVYGVSNFSPGSGFGRGGWGNIYFFRYVAPILYLSGSIHHIFLESTSIYACLCTFTFPTKVRVWEGVGKLLFLRYIALIPYILRSFVNAYAVSNFLPGQALGGGSTTLQRQCTVTFGGHCNGSRYNQHLFFIAMWVKIAKFKNFKQNIVCKMLFCYFLAYIDPIVVLRTEGYFNNVAYFHENFLK